MSKEGSRQTFGRALAVCFAVELLQLAEFFCQGHPGQQSVDPFLNLLPLKGAGLSGQRDQQQQY